MLVNVSFIIELLKLQWLVASRHSQMIYHLRIWLGIGVGGLNDAFDLVANNLFDELLLSCPDLEVKYVTTVACP